MRAVVLSLVIASALVVGASVQAKERRPGFPLGVGAGEITTTSATLWARAPRSGQVTLTVLPPNAGTRANPRLGTFTAPPRRRSALQRVGRPRVRERLLARRAWRRDLRGRLARACSSTTRPRRISLRPGSTGRSAGARREGYAAERARVLEALQGVRNVVFLTTDTLARLIGEIRTQTARGARVTDVTGTPCAPLVLRAA